jgi:hypothetical protein
LTMLSEQEKAFCQALLALRQKDYKTALGCFESVKGSLGTNSEFSLLYQTTRLLLAVKEELYGTADGDEEITKEIIING